jgi:hypothetical protein
VEEEEPSARRLYRRVERRPLWGLAPVEEEETSARRLYRRVPSRGLAPMVEEEPF